MQTLMYIDRCSACNYSVHTDVCEVRTYIEGGLAIKQARCAGFIDTKVVLVSVYI